MKEKWTLTDHERRTIQFGGHVMEKTSSTESCRCGLSIKKKENIITLPAGLVVDGPCPSNCLLENHSFTPQELHDFVVEGYVRSLRNKISLLEDKIKKSRNALA